VSYFKHPAAIVESTEIGDGTRIWANAHVLPGARIGADCNICDQTFIENKVVIGDRVTVKCGVQLWDGTVLEDDVFVGPNATFTNDKHPRSRQWPANGFPTTKVCRGASIGANATILPGITIGAGAMVGAGSVVTRDVAPHTTVAGNPARLRGIIPHRSAATSTKSPGAGVAPAPEIGVPGVRAVRLPERKDPRGSLVFGQVDDTLPFLPKRFFAIYACNPETVRGAHAHLECHQFLVCLHGSVRLAVDDGQFRDEVALNDPTLGVHIPPMTWTTIFGLSPDAVLLVLASDTFLESDYIRSYEKFIGKATIK
jgi:Acetyltransferase (isoleucine patch superfamily)